MNLLELMLKEEVEWPVAAEYAAQDGGDCTAHFYRMKPDDVKNFEWHLNENEGAWAKRPKHTFGVLASDWNTHAVAREEYQAAGGKMAVDSNEASPSLSAAEAATAKQATPKGSGNPILGMVLADLTNRALEGTAKYGEPLKARNGRNPLWDAYQEALDLAMYLRQAIEEQL